MGSLPANGGPGGLAKKRNLTRPRASRVIVCGVATVLLLLTGCSLTPGSGLVFFPQRHRLIDAAKEVRQTAPQALPRELDKHVLPPYLVEPGDVLLVQPADLESQVRLPADQPVLPDGTINLGRYGNVLVAGKTTAEIEEVVRAAIRPQAKDVGPITARLVNRTSKVYYVIGEVNAPGSFPLNGRETVLDGVIAAGGLTERADIKEIILSRPTPPESCRTVLPICLQNIVQLGDTTTNYQLAPGDRIFVPTRSGHQSMFMGHKKDKECTICDGPQQPCPPAAGAAPLAGPALLGQPVAPGAVETDSPPSSRGSLPRRDGAASSLPAESFPSYSSTP